MSIQLTLKRDLFTHSIHRRGEAAGHSTLSADPRKAQEILAKLKRIHERQTASGSSAGGWDPLSTWLVMLDDCCSHTGSHDQMF